MLNPSLSDLMKRVDSRYQLVNLIARRARDIVERGDSASLNEKPVKIAIDEINDGKVVLKRK
ncbi:MAG: DNA-directed RNA polymerase subunit omega [Clostridiales bacterium]|nr:DNA-directed RNA polymerase subunit omega [Clostridiales bacterium]